MRILRTIPHLTEDGGSLLCGITGAKLVGIDSLNIDDIRGNEPSGSLDAAGGIMC